MELIKEVIKNKFNRNSDVICLGLLYEEDCKLDELAISVGLDANEDSAYKSILREVIWFE